jgi:hypothetical protein
MNPGMAFLPSECTARIADLSNFYYLELQDSLNNKLAFLQISQPIT